MVNYDLDGKVVFITGAASGIGLASAKVCAASGARLVLCDVEPRGLDEAVAVVKDLGGSAIGSPLDVRDAAEVERAVALAVETYGRLDAAFNAAGILGPAFRPILELDQSEWQKIIDINLTGVWLSMKYQVAQMVHQGGGGSIVNASSVAGLGGTRMNTAYGASKHGVSSLTRTVAIEYGRQSIRVNAICPGWIDTAMTAHVSETMPERITPIMARTHLGRFGKPEEIAELVAWLCSDASSFVTGSTYPIDGGMMA